MERTRERLFEILVGEHAPALLAFIRSCGVDGAAADDIAQESFASAWNALDDYDQSRPFAAWLRGIARNKLLEFRRRCATERKHLQVLSPEQLDGVAAEFQRFVHGRGDIFDETLSVLRACLQRLSPADREIIRQVYEKGRTCRALADAARQTVDCMKKRLQRCRAGLRDCMMAKLSVRVTHG